MQISQIISIFGGVNNMARLLSYKPARISAWKARNSIPAKQQRILLEAGKKNNIDIKPEDFFYPQS